MDYKSLYASYLKSIKSLNTELESFRKREKIDTEDGMHIVFGMVVLPFIFKNLNNADFLSQSFGFFEEMSKCENHLIQEVLEFTILEGIADQGEGTRNTLKSFMKSNTLIIFEKICDYMNLN